MNKTLFWNLLFWIVIQVINPMAYAQSELEKGVKELEDAPPLARSVVEGGKVSGTLKDDVTEAQLLEVSLRMDLSFTGGKPVEQGFAIPSLRFGASGDVARFIDYSFALGQTREFGSALIPQVLPVEAWIQLRDAGKNSWKSDTVFAWKLGMFTPTINPMWSPDIGELPIPDYFDVHQRLFLSRDIGTELVVWPLPGHLGVMAGVFNGSGITTLNTNNTRAFNIGLQGGIPFETSILNVGIGGYLLTQAERGGVNFISNWVSNLFALWQREDESLLVFGDISSGRLEDSTREASVFGYTGLTAVRLFNWLKAFGRIEGLRYSPSSDQSLDHFQIGTVFEITKAIDTFLFYDYLKYGSGSDESSGQVVVRLSI